MFIIFTQNVHQMYLCITMMNGFNIVKVLLIIEIKYSCFQLNTKKEIKLENLR